MTVAVARRAAVRTVPMRAGAAMPRSSGRMAKCMQKRKATLPRQRDTSEEQRATADTRGVAGHGRH